MPLDATLRQQAIFRQLIWHPPRSMTCGPCGPPLTGMRNRSVGPACSSAGNVLCRSTSSTTMSFRMVSASSGWAGGDQDRPSSDSHTRRSPTSALPVPPRQPRPLHSLKTSLAAARQNATKVHVDPIVSDWFLVVPHQWKTERRWDMQHCLTGVWRLRPGMFGGISANTLYRCKQSAPTEAPLGRGTVLSPAYMTRVSGRTMRVCDVLCLSAVTIRSLVHELCDAEGLDIHPGTTWVKQLLRGMRLSNKTPAKCVKELHVPERQRANTHQLFVKLCWLMNTHTLPAQIAS